MSGASNSADEVARAIESFRSGDDPDSAFAILFRSHYRPIRRFFARKGLAPEVCLDLTQEVFLGIYRGLSDYRPEARFEAWLYTVANNAYLKHLRAHRAGKRQGIEVAVDDAPPIAAGDDPLDSVLDDERRRRLEAAVAELPEQMRRCLELRLYQGWSYRQIATLAGISEETVKAHLFQGRRRLRQRLAEPSETAP